MKVLGCTACVALVCLLVAGCYDSRALTGSDAGTGGTGDSGERDAKPDAGVAADTGSKPDAGTSTTLDGGASNGAIGDAAPRPVDAGATDAALPPPLPSTDPGLRVAVFGDQGLGANPIRVLELVRSEGADLVIHLGDFDYQDNPTAWGEQIDAVLGHDYPYFATIGNHDVAAWDGPNGYQAMLEARLASIPGATCTGRLGVRASCTYRGLFFVLSGVGTLDTGHEQYLSDALASSDRIFKLCTWHKNQHDLQVGGKTDEVGWGAYQACQQAGALILTAHEHSYSRTYSLTAIGDATLDHGATGIANLLTLRPGSSAVLVAGLGGHSRRAFLPDRHADDSWWAAVYAKNRQVQGGLQTGIESNIDDGVLFIDFHVDADPRRARGRFVTTAGTVQDSFAILVAPP